MIAVRLGRLIGYGAIAIAVTGVVVGLAHDYLDRPYFSADEDPTTKELTLSISPGAFCGNTDSRRMSKFEHFSYDMSGSKLALLDYKSGDKQLMLFTIYCNEPLSSVAQPVVNEGLTPQFIVEESGVVVTQREDVFRFVAFLDQPTQEIRATTTVIDLITGSYNKQGVAVGACYYSIERCYLAVAKGTRDAEQGNPDMKNVNYVWAGVDAPADQLIEVGKNTALALMKAINRPCTACGDRSDAN